MARLSPKSLVLGFLILFVCVPVVEVVQAEANGGTPCAACTLVFQLLLNLMVVDDAKFDHVLLNYCTTLPEPYTTPCIVFADQFGEQLVDYVGANASSDQMCRALGVCTNSTCNLMPTRDGILPEQRTFVTEGTEEFLEQFTVWEWLQQAIYKWTSDHVPPIDVDGDKFSSVTETLRGANWRGKDCDGLSNQVYPGRKDTSFPDAIDQDCNGIYGRDHLARSYENLYCSDTDRRGIISLGDSATAHFRIPPQYMTASDINSYVFLKVDDDTILFIG